MGNFTLRQLQREQREWSERNFGSQPPYQPLLGVIEEVGELAHAQLKHEQQIRQMTDETFRASAEDAIGDIVVFLAGYCSAIGVDFQDAVEQTWVQVIRRDWKGDPDKAGGQSTQSGWQKDPLAEYNPA